MIQTKLFTASALPEQGRIIDLLINQWLKDHPHIHLLDTKFNTVYNPSMGLQRDSVLLIYETGDE